MRVTSFIWASAPALDLGSNQTTGARFTPRAGLRCPGLPLQNIPEVCWQTDPSKYASALRDSPRGPRSRSEHLGLGIKGAVPPVPFSRDAASGSSRSRPGRSLQGLQERSHGPVPLDPAELALGPHQAEQL